MKVDFILMERISQEKIWVGIELKRAVLSFSGDWSLFNRLSLFPVFQKAFAFVG